MSVSFYENIVKHIQLTHSLRSSVRGTEGLLKYAERLVKHIRSHTTVV